MKSTERYRIERAARRFGVAPGLVAAILADELRRRNLWDHGQDILAQWLLDLPTPLSVVLQQVAEYLTGRPLDDQSFGLAQTKPATLRELDEAGVLPVPRDLRLQLALLLRWEYTPLLIAARLRQILDYWTAGGVDLSRQQEVLATLYSLGLTGRRGVHPHPVANSRGKAVAEMARGFQ